MEENRPVEKAPDMVLTQETVVEQKTPPKSNKENVKRAIGITTFIFGMLMLLAGVVLLVVNLTKQPDARDADYLVEMGEWTREDKEGVIWKFTEIGKGVLTTNNHANDYDFIWSAENGKLKIETDWLYTLNDDYDYEIRDGKLILNNDITFAPVKKSEE